MKKMASDPDRYMARGEAAMKELLGSLLYLHSVSCMHAGSSWIIAANVPERCFQAASTRPNTPIGVLVISLQIGDEMVYDS